MCVGIILKTGEHLETVQEVEEHFKTELKNFIAPGYIGVSPEQCLCCIDLDKFFGENPKLGNFEPECGEWWEK